MEKSFNHIIKTPEFFFPITHMTVYMKFLNRSYTLVRTFYDTEENIRTGSNTCSHSI